MLDWALARRCVTLACLWVIAAALLMACSSGSVATTVVPTITLIPSTSTPTPGIPVATETPLPVIRAASLARDIPPEIQSIDDEVQRALALRALDDLTGRFELARNEVLLVALLEAEWDNARLLGCPQTSARDRIPGYRMVFVSATSVYDYHSDQSDNLRLCEVLSPDEVTDELLTIVDPVAAEIFALAQRQLVEELDIPTRRVQLASMQSLTWPDTSLGCPTQGQRYQQVTSPGYRLVLEVADEQRIFHSNFQTIIECAPEDEVLPIPEPEATAESTAEVTAEATPDS